ncbi:MAG: outer membrane protein assembly factor BamD [Rickettsiales bacterium]
MLNNKTIFYILSSFIVVSCSNGDDDLITHKKVESPESIYNRARDNIDEGNYNSAITDFEEVERQHPYSPLSTDAQIMAAYASYRIEKYDEAIAMLERFVKLYPSSDSTPYAYYLIAICYYDQISDVGRDQMITQQALQALNEVARRFPNSDYARDAKIKADLTRDHLAGKEMEIGRYYLKQDDTIAAINRFRYVVDNYQTTSHVPEALHRLVESYLTLGVVDEAKRYAAVLGYNFPNSSWYRDSYRLMEEYGSDTSSGLKKPEKESSWWDSIIP